MARVVLKKRWLLRNRLVNYGGIIFYESVKFSVTQQIRNEWRIEINQIYLTLNKRNNVSLFMI